MGRIAIAIIVVAASPFLAWVAMTHGFGPSALLVVPICCLGYYLAATSVDRGTRISGFLFASVMIFLLPALPWWSGFIHASFHKINDIVWPLGHIAYDTVEMVGMLAEFVLPSLLSMVLAWLAVIAVRAFMKATQADDAPYPTIYRFTLRGMLLVMIVCGALSAWITNTVRHWQYQEQTRQSAFVDQFKQTFTSGHVVLLDEPQIAGGSIQSHLKQYRISAPIVANGKERWAVWTYWMDAPSSLILNYGYTEAPTRDMLPFPVAEYLNQPVNVSSLTDGEPKSTTRAELINVPKSAQHGTTLELVARTDHGMQCDLEIQPFYARKDVPVTKLAPPSGIVTWKVPLDPNYQGSKIEYTISFRTNTLYRANSVNGVISLVKADDVQSKATKQKR